MESKPLHPENLRRIQRKTWKYMAVGWVMTGVTMALLGFNNATDIPEKIEKAVFAFLVMNAVTAIPVAAGTWVVNRWFTPWCFRTERMGLIHGVLASLFVVWIACAVFVLALGPLSAIESLRNGSAVALDPKALVEAFVGGLLLFGGYSTLLGSPTILVLGLVYGANMRRIAEA